MTLQKIRESETKKKIKSAYVWNTTTTTAPPTPSYDWIIKIFCLSSNFPMSNVNKGGNCQKYEAKFRAKGEMRANNTPKKKRRETNKKQPHFSAGAQKYPSTTSINYLFMWIVICLNRKCKIEMNILFANDLRFQDVEFEQTDIHTLTNAHRWRAIELIKRLSSTNVKYARLLL